jgi:hypothetical protein
MKLYIHIVNGKDESLGYVSGFNPVTYDAVKSNALKIEFDFSTIDVDEVENKVWAVVEALIDETGSMDWSLNIETDTEDELAHIVCSDSGLATAVNPISPLLTLQLERSIREFSMCLADYLSTKALTLAAKSVTSQYVPKSGTGPTSTSTVQANGASSDEIDKLIQSIENKTKASIVKPKETLDDYVCNDTL